MFLSIIQNCYFFLCLSKKNETNFTGFWGRTWNKKTGDLTSLAKDALLPSLVLREKYDKHYTITSIREMAQHGARRKSSSLFFLRGYFFYVLSHRKIKKIFFPFLYSYSGTNGPGITLNEKGRYPARRHQCVQRVAKGITKRNNPSLFFFFLFLLLYNFLSFLSFFPVFLSLSPAAAAAATFVWQFWLGNLSDATPP